ncbi:hypothetical protein KAR48_12845 [bacterium]|nr:hypothetical protein [bacterium]
MKRICILLLILTIGSAPLDSICQEKQPHFKKYMAAVSLGNLAGFILTASVVRVTGGTKEGNLDGLSIILGVGPLAGSNLGALAVSAEKSKVFRFNMIATALPFLALYFIDNTLMLSALYSVIAIPIITMISSYNIDKREWEQVNLKSQSSVHMPVKNNIYMSCVEPAKILVKIPIFNMSW